MSPQTPAAVTRAVPDSAGAGMRCRLLHRETGCAFAAPSAGAAVLLLSCALLPPSAAAPQIQWSEPVTIATGKGVRGEWRQNDSNYDHVDDGTPAFDRDGNLAVAWVDQGKKDVFLQVFATDGVARSAEPVNVSRTPGVFSWHPRVVVAPDRPAEIFVLWQEIVFSGGSHGGDMFFARSRDGGATFSSPLNLSNSVFGDGKGRINQQHWQNGSFDLLMSADGVLHAAWTDFEGNLWWSRSPDRGARFTRPQRVASAEPYPARAPSLAGGAGVVYLAWTVGENASADIHFARLGSEAVASRKVVFESPGYSDAPRLATDRQGVVHLVYAESDGGPFERSSIRYAQSIDAGASFTPPKELSARGGRASASYPGLVADGRGGVFVYWEISSAPGERPRGLGFTASADGGKTFAPSARVSGSADPEGGANGSHQGLLMRKLAVAPDGTLALINSSMKPGAHSRVWLLRGRR